MCSLIKSLVAAALQASHKLFVDFSPKPLENEPGNGFHINMSVKPSDSSENLCYMIAGVLDKVVEMTAFLNPALYRLILAASGKSSLFSSPLSAA